MLETRACLKSDKYEVWLHRQRRIAYSHIGKCLLSNLDYISIINLDYIFGDFNFILTVASMVNTHCTTICRHNAVWYAQCT